MDKDKGRIKEALPLNVIYFVSHSTQAAVLWLFCLFLRCSWLVLGLFCLSWLVLGLFRLFLGHSGAFRLLVTTKSQFLQYYSVDRKSVKRASFYIVLAIERYANRNGSAKAGFVNFFSKLLIDFKKLDDLQNYSKSFRFSFAVSLARL